jgi:mRNA interferase RelE/StbE
VYSIKIKRKAEKELSKLPVDLIERIVTKIDSLSRNPRPEGVKKLKGGSFDYYRIRIGSYRVIYSVDDEIKVVDVRKIGHRKDVYE